MQLVAALRANLTDVVAFTGGGGKTSAMFRLAAEIIEAGGQVITTTTTRIFAAQIRLAPTHVAVHGLPSDDPAALEVVAAALAQTGHALVTAPVEAGTEKAHGIDPGWIAALRGLPGRPAVLIEADGSRMRPFKAPAEHEPVIPLETDLVVPVIGAEVIGARLEPALVHRPERVAALAGLALGDVLTPAAVAQVMVHLQGGLKGIPDSARVMVLINKVEGGAAHELARLTAIQLLAHNRISGVVLGAVRHDQPAIETLGRVAVVVLAAGRSTRMGRSKQLLRWGDTTVVGEVVRRLQGCGVARVLVVTGDAGDSVTQAVAAARLPSGAPVELVHNPDFAASEMAWSLAAGLRALPPNCLAALVALADQPRLNPSVVQRLVARWQETQAMVVAPYYRGQRGHPLLFDRRAWPRLLSLPAAANPRAALETLPPPERVEVDDDSILQDLDTPEAYASALANP
jgi:molybdenum cofactor cytidylyltransferase